MRKVESKMTVPGDGLHEANFIAVYKPTGKKIKVTFTVRTQFQTAGGTEFNISFDPKKEAVTISALQEGGLCSIVEQEINKVEEVLVPQKRGRKPKNGE